MTNSIANRRRDQIARFVFVLTYGRSGSTLLMGLLNSLPHYCIRGENNNIVYRIFEACRALESAGVEELKNAERPTHPWYGMHQSSPSGFGDAMIRAFIDNVLCPEPSHTVAGFKEIRHSKAEVPDFDGYLSFLRTRFPHTRLIFNHRRLDDVASSKWWSNMPMAMEKLQIMEDRFNAVPAGPDVFHFHYDRIDDSLDHIRELFSFLNESMDEMAIRSILKVKHSY